MSETNRRSNIVSMLLVVALAGGGWFFFRHYEIDGLEGVAVRPKSAEPLTETEDDLRHYLDGDHSWPISQQVASVPGTGGAAVSTGSGDLADAWPTSEAAGPADRERASASTVGFRSAVTSTAAASPVAGRHGDQPEKIRVAAWNLAGFGREKAAKPQVMDMFARVVRTFDVIALQDVMAMERDRLPRMVEHVNRTGRRYDFLLAPPPPSENGETSMSRLAILFDTERIVTDRTQFYTVADPDDAFTHDPIVGWFQIVGPPRAQAWTFSLVNIHIDLANAKNEVALLPRVLEAVRSDGRNEDDLLMAGLFQADDAYLVPSVGESAVRAVVRATPTDIFGRHQTSNILLPRHATTEFLGGGGVVDFLRLYNLSSAEAEEVTFSLPVYAEFSPREGE